MYETFYVTAFAEPVLDMLERDELIQVNMTPVISQDM